ncbi:putative transcription factor C2H2 family [Helianthus debilis subsp. tardiflorus]
MKPSLVTSKSSSYGIIVPSSYGIIVRRTRTFIIVGSSDRVDTLLDITPLPPDGSHEIVQFKRCNETVPPFDDGLPYEKFRLIFTSNNGSVVTSRYLSYNQSDQVLNYVEDEKTHQSSLKVARFVLWCDNFLRKGLPKATEDAVKVRRLLAKDEEEEDGEICVICRDKYQAEHTIGTLACKHSYHEECIRKWLDEKKDCPMCRIPVFHYYF